MRTWSATEPAPAQHSQERLHTAAVRLARTLPSSDTPPVVGVVRGWSRADRDRARTLRRFLAAHGVRSTDVTPVPRRAQHASGQHGPDRPEADLLVHTGGPGPEEAMRAAALWRLPLLIGHPGQHGHPEQDTLRAYRRPVIAARLAQGQSELGVREAAVIPLQPAADRAANLLLDEEKITLPGDQPLRIRLTDNDDLLQVDGPAFGVRRVRALSLDGTWGACRLDVDGLPARDVREGLHMESQPGRLHLLHP
ncbi:hypothetical protein [Streptomyces sp. YIM 98790]|uniref:hypothetical protein n=1 Tax=Streptomyces sp. YIM 98790 TaxID=2689077 RepID=UPI00140DC756|nr:hypothetical protein [Streptomyces sp. YIM 98790]